MKHRITSVTELGALVRATRKSVQYHGGELRLLRAIRHFIVAQMLEKIS